jgi:hypothetical protein
MDSIMMSIPDKIVVDECGCLTSTSEKSAKTNKTREQIISKRNTITGPLVFLGAGVMKLSAYTMDV